MIPLSLYIHIPWCERKCPYCDFNSHLRREEVDEAAYVAALLADLQQDLHCYATALDGRTIDSIFIGGGTPSLFAPANIADLLNGVGQLIAVATTAEITLEANPGSSEAKKFAAFREAGINRLSIGIQSFNDSHLNALGRVHNAAQACAAVKTARSAGFDNLNLDLMYGLPEQTLDQACADLEQALSFAPAHLSCYQLTIEPNTLFHQKPPPRPDDETLWQMQLALQAILGEHGYDQYEVSAYAQPNRRCKHNLNYWGFGDYLGIGAGAHGKLTDPEGNVSRYWKIKHPASYLAAKNAQPQGAPDWTGGRHQVAQEQLGFEFMLNALRLTHGFEPSIFTQRTGLKLDHIADTLQQQKAQGLLEVSAQNIRASTCGRQYLDTLLQDYLPD